MHTLKLIPLILREYTSGTQKVVKIPLIDRNYLNILQVLKLKFPKIDKRGKGDIYQAPKSIIRTYFQMF